MPSVWEIQFCDVDPSHVRSSGIHRFLSAWFRETQSEHSGLKGYSVGPRRDDRSAVAIEVRCVDDRLADLVASIPAGQQVQFGTTHPRLAAVRVPPRCMATMSWAELATYRGTSQWRLELQSPVVVSYGHVDQPWPAPAPILRGLDAKWSKWGPQVDSTYDERLAGLIAVTGADLRTVECHLAPTPVWGATGAVEWTWLGVQTTRHADLSHGATIIERLLALSRFTGIGGYTQHGLGSVAISGRLANTRRHRHA